MQCSNCVSCIFDNPNIPSDAHEIHITVDNADVNTFIEACQYISAKPVLIAIQSDGGEFRHLMSSKTIRASCETVRAIAEGDAEILKRYFDVSRVKIETTLTNPIIPDHEDGYFESHIEIIVPSWYPHKDIGDKVRQTSRNLHLSRNAWKTEGDTKSFFVTTRKFAIYEWTPRLFDFHVSDTVEGLSEHFKIGKVRSEFAWFDTNINLDNEWRTV